MSPRKRRKQVAFRPEQLLKVLELERERGFDDKAVAGGTARMLLARWLEPAAAKARSLRSRQRLATLAAALKSYREVGPEARAAVVEAVVRELRAVLEPGEQVRLDAPVSVLAGIGPARALAMSVEGVHTVEDLLLCLPRGYLDVGAVTPVAELADGAKATVRVRVVRGPELLRGLRVSRVEAVAEDGSGQVLLVFYNQPWWAEKLAVGSELTAVGRMRQMRQRRALVVEQVVPPEAIGGPGPVVATYKLAGIPEQVVRKAVGQALEECGRQLEPVVPQATAKAAGLMTRPESIAVVHRPANMRQAETARRSLVFERLLALQVRLLQHRARVRRPSEEAVLEVDGLADEIERLAGFELTGAQRRVIGEIEADLADELPAYRLVHGDVGCGKTVVVAAALLAAAQAGAQGAMMAPTEVLAEQHAARLEKLLGPAGVDVWLLTGSLSARAKDAARAAAADGRPGVWVGTHALIQRSVEFKRLAVAVVDEQHRFGVAQRGALAAKGLNPNFIAVSATPIPRTLALAMYADFDISVIDEMPPGRKRVRTVLIGPRRRPEAYELVRQRVRAGQQAFVICPLVEASDVIEAEAAVQRFEQLRDGELRGLRLGLVHGRMATPERQSVMERFYRGEIDVLVSTTVIEVGVDVPNASVIVVESAERFGLAQLHQLRGRVARSPHQPVCVLVASAKGKEAAERLNILVQHADGLAIAEADLRLRGAGELAGLRQHGPSDWVVGDVLRYPDLLAAARAAAEKVVEKDPRLIAAEHRGLAEAVRALGQIEESGWAL